MKNNKSSIIFRTCPTTHTTSKALRGIDELLARARPFNCRERFMPPFMTPRR
jgi:hypothetical protein